MNELDKLRLKRLQLRAAEYIEIRKAYAVEGIKIAKLGNKIYSELELFWAKQRGDK